jgi:hypothetical protein
MAAKQKLTGRDTMELMLKLESDTHSSEEVDISPQSDSDTNSDTNDFTGTICTK